MYLYTYYILYIYNIYIYVYIYIYISKVGLRRNYLHKYDTLGRNCR